MIWDLNSNSGISTEEILLNTVFNEIKFPTHIYGKHDRLKSRDLIAMSENDISQMINN